MEEWLVFRYVFPPEMLGRILELTNYNQYSTTGASKDVCIVSSVDKVHLKIDTLL